MSFSQQMDKQAGTIQQVNSSKKEWALESSIDGSQRHSAKVYVVSWVRV